MFHPENYGGIFRKDMIYDKVSGHGLLVAGCLENGYPTPPNEIQSMLEIVAKNLSVPIGIVKPSSFEAFFSHVDPDTLPLYKGEIGNDWNRAAGGDPKKTALLRAFGRAYQPDVKQKPTVKRLFAEALALSAGEHNYGVVYKGGGPWTNYSNQIGPASWEEQRNLINISALSLMADEDPSFMEDLEPELAALARQDPPPTAGLTPRYTTKAGGGGCAAAGAVPVSGGGSLGANGWEVQFNCSGAITMLTKTEGAVHLASAANPLALVVIPGQTTLPVLQSIWSDPKTGSVLINAVANGSKTGLDGQAMYQHYLQLEFSAGYINVTVYLGKAADVINGAAASQAVYLHFNPATSDPELWSANEQGIDVPVTFPNRCSLRHYKCVWAGMSHPSAGRLSGAAATAGGGGHVPMKIDVVDSPLVAFLTNASSIENIMHMDLVSGSPFLFWEYSDDHIFSEMA